MKRRQVVPSLPAVTRCERDARHAIVEVLPLAQELHPEGRELARPRAAGTEAGGSARGASKTSVTAVTAVIPSPLRAFRAHPDDRSVTAA